MIYYVDHYYINKEIKILGLYDNFGNYIGKISEKAKWVKIDDIFNEEEITFDKIQTYKDVLTLIEGDEVELLDDILHKTTGVIKEIELFDRLLSQPDEEDKLILTNVKKEFFDEKGLIDSEDIVVLRSDVKYNGKEHVICRIKCDKCDTFH